MTREMEYSFADLQIIPGAHLVAEGTATIRYTIAPAEPDTGIPRRYLDYFYVLSIELDPYVIGDKGATVAPGHQLFWPIARALENHERGRIEEACLEDENEWSDC